MIGTFQLILNQNQVSSMNIACKNISPEHSHMLFFGFQDELHSDRLCQ